VSVQSFNHFNIRAPRPLLEEVRQFYIEVIGLEEGFRPEIPVHGYWLYLEDLPVLHLMEWAEGRRAPNSEKGYLDHVAFSCDDLTGFLEKLDRMDIEFIRRDFELLSSPFTQLHLTDPVGNGVELNFNRGLCN
tara:strand:+ start:136 stop:534 length:399 start_codon:yes stop_codon:yes gene_type:complete